MRQTTSIMARLIRWAAWLAVVGLVVLTVVPSSMRPNSHLPHAFEHFVSFLLAGTLQYLARPGRLVPWLAAGIVFAGFIELLQIPLPSRDARVEDFIIDGLGACAGIAIGFLLVRSRFGHLFKFEQVDPQRQ